jgi:predicted MPP superfamily phosphohydrolase
MLCAAGLGSMWYSRRWLNAQRSGLGSWLFALSAVLAAVSQVVIDERFAPRFLATTTTAMAAAFYFWVLAAVSLFFYAATHQHPEAPARRLFLGKALTAAPLAMAGYGIFIERSDLRLHEVELAVPGLPHDLDGVRIGQITDIHRGPFLSQRELERAVGLLNEAKPQVMAATGDFISEAGDPLEECLQAVARLRSDAGVFVCLGNHERRTGAERVCVKLGGQLGMRILRGTGVPLRFGGAVLNLAGVDYQSMREPYLRGAERLIQPGALNVLLSHNPDVFPVAARQGFAVTLAGHTHGGQVNVEILEQSVNAARFFTPYTRGLYRRDGALIYVSRGVGTVGAPLRIGSPPEVTVFRLCAA